MAIPLVKKAVIEITLVEECSQRSNNDIAGDIFSDLSVGGTLIPWCKQVNKVVVLDGDTLY
jgi:hypothetical protein